MIKNIGKESLMIDLATYLYGICPGIMRSVVMKNCCQTEPKKTPSSQGLTVYECEMLGYDTPYSRVTEM